MEKFVLLSADPSPFGHKVRVAAALAGLPLKIEPVSTLTPGSALRKLNPLGKIPVLVRQDGSPIFDSTVIIELFNQLSVAKNLLPDDSHIRMVALQRQALGDGIADAAILIYAEYQWREAGARCEQWVAHQAGKVARSLEIVETECASWSVEDAHAGNISIACTLHYLRVRFGPSVAARWPSSFAWLQHFSDAVPSFALLAPNKANFAPHLKQVETELLCDALLKASLI